MRSIIYLFLFTVFFGISASAQESAPKVSELPADIAAWVGEDADKILENEIIKVRLKKLLGEKNFASFTEYFETRKPIGKKGDFLFASGCMIRACTHLESAVAIDLETNTIHAAIYDEIEETKYFNENGRNTPEPIIEWANRLENLKKTDAETIQPEAVLIAEFSHDNNEILLLELDNYVNKLQDDPNASGCIIINGSKKSRSKAEKQIKNHIKNRGLDYNRLVFQNGDGDSKAVIELWLVPAGAEPPAPKKSGETAVKKEPEKVQPKTFVIFQMTVRDAEMYEQYRIAVEPLLKKYGGKYLVRSGGLSYDDDPDTKLTPVEGEWNPDRLIIIQWDSMEQLQKFIKSVEYQKIAVLREKSATTKSVVVREYLKN